MTDPERKKPGPRPKVKEVVVEKVKEEFVNVDDSDEPWITDSSELKNFREDLDNALASDFVDLIPEEVLPYQPFKPSSLLQVTGTFRTSGI